MTTSIAKATATDPQSPTNRPEDHFYWCENVLPESLIRISENPITGIYETDRTGTDCLDAAMSCALELPIETLKEALAESGDNSAKVRHAIAQIEQIEIDAVNISCVLEEDMTEEYKLRRRQRLDELRRVRYATPAELNAIAAEVSR